MSTIGTKSTYAVGVRPSRHGGWAGKALVASFVATTALLSAPVAWAANAARLSVGVEIKPAADAASGTPIVSVSRSNLSSFFSVRMTVTNGGTNTVNNVAVKGTTTVYEGLIQSSAVAHYAVFLNLGSASPNCTQPSDPVNVTVNTVTCTIGQLASQESREFFLIFQAPTAGSRVNFNAHTTFSSGNSSQTPPADFDEDQNFAVDLTTVQTPDVNKKVKTVLPPLGGNFFTGQNAAVDSLNPFSTKVTVPTVNGLVTENTIEQPDTPSGSYPCLSNPTYFCFGLKSTIEIKYAQTGDRVYFHNTTGPIIKIYLRQDVSTLGKPIPKIGTVKIFYTSPLATQPSLVDSCAATGGPTQNVPCWEKRTDAVKGSKGYYEYLIHAKDNGVFSW